MRSPGSILGSSARTIDKGEARDVIERLAQRGVDALIYAGGNRAMGGAALLATAAAEAKSALKVIGLPNAAGNDVVCTDHTPGFASAARFYALAVRDLDEDSRALAATVTVVETMGGKTGWLTAATALARATPEDGPHLVYLPEQSADEGQVLEEVKTAVKRYGRAVVVACEGQDIAQKIEVGTGFQTRAARLGLLARSCSWALSEMDVEESYRSGRAAAETVLGGASGLMIALRRQPGLVYRSFPHPVPFSEDPGRERKMPAQWLAEPGAGGNEDYLEWLRPLVGEIPPIERIL
jgi:6-phosphofructokinase 1